MAKVHIKHLIIVNEIIVMFTINTYGKDIYEEFFPSIISHTLI